MFNVLSQNLNFLYHLWSLSQLGSTISIQLLLNFIKKWVVSKIGWKTKLLHFRNDLWVLFISKMDSNSTLKISKIHDIWALDPFQAQEVTGETLRPWPEKLKISKCSVLNQILGEGCLWLLKVLHGLISQRNISQSYLCMFQVRYIHFLKFWAEQIHALPNSVRWFPNSGILLPTSPNISGKPIKIIQNSRNNFYSLILHLLIESSI